MNMVPGRLQESIVSIWEQSAERVIAVSNRQECLLRAPQKLRHEKVIESGQSVPVALPGM